MNHTSFSRLTPNDPRDASDGVAAGATDGVPEVADELTRLRAEVSGLRRAMQTQAVIEQAKGMLMMRFGLTADAAFALLVRLSQDNNRKVSAICTAVTDLGRRADGLASSIDELARKVTVHPECAHGEPES